jgi:hypothetical protein
MFVPEALRTECGNEGDALMKSLFAYGPESMVPIDIVGSRNEIWVRPDDDRKKTPRVVE